jgi:hypothetical protein
MEQPLEEGSRLEGTAHGTGQPMEPDSLLRGTDAWVGQPLELDSQMVRTACGFGQPLGTDSRLNWTAHRWNSRITQASLVSATNSHEERGVPKSGLAQTCSATARDAYSLLILHSCVFHVQEQIQGFYVIDIPSQVNR